MRQIPIDEPRARYDRLVDVGDRTLLALHGLRMDPEITAPFTVAWHGRPVLLLDQTQVAHVHDMTLHVRPEVPAEFDTVILRAFRNAADVTDELGKRVRAEAKEAAAFSKVLTRTHENFRIKISPEDFKKALIGMEALEPRFRFSVTSGKLVGSWTTGNNSISQYFEPEGQEILVRPSHAHNAYAFREADFLKAMKKGREFWDLHVCPEQLLGELREIMARHPLDEVSVEHRFRLVPKAEAELRSLYDGNIVGRCHNYGTYRGNPEFSHNGLRFGCENEVTPYMSLFPDLLNAGEVRGAVNRLKQHWMCAVAEINPNAVLKLRSDEVRMRIEATDFGYDL